MRTLFLMVSCVWLCACATSKVDVRPVSITPIEQIKSDPFDLDEKLAEAEDYYNAEDYKDAVKTYMQLMTFDPDHAEARLGLGQSLMAMGKFEQAARIFWAKHAATEEADLKDAFALGKIISGVYTDRYDNAENAIHDGILINPKDARLWNAKGQWHDRRAEWMDSLACYVTAMESGKWRSSTINNMGMSLLLQGRFDEAKDKFKQAKSINPETEIYDNNLRMAHILTNDLRTALSGIDSNRSADLLNDAGFVLAGRGNKSLAARLFKKALDISPVFHPKAQANLDRLSKLH